jgi:hypothetical protein
MLFHFLFLFSILAFVSNVSADSFALLPPAEYYANADFVLLGTIMSVDEKDESVLFPSGDTQVFSSSAKIAVQKSWKIFLKGEVIIYSPGIIPVDPDAPYSDSSFPFEEGKKVLIFGRMREDGIYYTSAGQGSMYEGSVGYPERLDYSNSKPKATDAIVVVSGNTDGNAVDGNFTDDINAGSVDDENETETGGESELDTGDDGEMDETNSGINEEGEENTIGENAAPPTNDVLPVQSSPKLGILETILAFLRNLFSFS